jgi:hypothetical protein
VIGPQSFLSYARFRWLKLSLLLLGACLGIYALVPAPGGRNGGTPLGYSLGILCALLMLWLLAFGVRKRRYGTRGAPLRGWLSAHVYLGSILLVLVPLHSGFEFAWNVHTAAYAVMSAVIVSGFFGVGFYGLVPTPMTENRPGEKLAGLLKQIAEIDGQCRNLGRELPDFYSTVIRTSIDETRIGGGLLRQLSGREPRCGTARAFVLLSEHRETDPTVADERRQLASLLVRKQALLARVRRDVRYKALLDLWLLFHVPLAMVSVALVAVHVYIVLFYGSLNRLAHG